MNSTIFITYSVEGFHKWEDATGKRAYLANLHRHLFKVKVTMSVFHEDREVEFHDLLDQCKSYSEVFKECPTWSCEMHAKYLIDELQKRYSDRLIQVEVSEDGECGATVQFNPRRDD